MRKFRRGCAVVLAFVLLASVVFTGSVGRVSAQGNVPKDSYRQWTMGDVSKILNNSPWAKTQVIRIVPRRQVRTIAGQGSISDESSSTAARQAGLGGAEPPVDYNFTIRLRSALPVRQAIARLLQLDSKYDQMSAAEQKKLDAQTSELLECRECADNYVVSVGFGSTDANSRGADIIYKLFSAQTLDSVRQQVYLANERGGRRELIGFVPPKVPGDEAFFLFPRLDERGRPLFTPADKKVIFRMSDINPSSVTNFTLDVKKLLVNGKVEF
jgi:hypothetical protein